MNAQNPRQIAARVLNRQKNNGEFTENLLERELANAKLSAVDRGLCQEIIYGVVRRQSTLDWLIARKTNGREQKSTLQNLLRLGLYQIFWLDKIPPHAAVHETVELAKQNGFGPQAGFVNAILRGYLREFDETKKILAELKISNLAVGFSHQQWLVEKWQKRFGAEKTAQLLEWNNTPPKTFARVNTLKIGGASVPASRLVSSLAPPKDAGALLEKWRDENVEYDFVRRDWLEENLIFELKSHPPLTSLESFRDGWFYIQDPSTLLAPILLAAQLGETILDLCAAPGGKTTFIAQLMNGTGKIVACDISEERLKLIQENCARLGVTCVEFCRSRGDEAHSEKSEISQRLLTSSPTIFDRVLVDAPCSNSGVMRRRVDLRWRISPEEISRLRQTQLDLLKLAATKLKPGGVLIYSTCSLEPEENSEVVKEFLREHKNFNLESERQLLPFADNVDGAFVARLKKLA
ncbi:MAG TPA: 16S rRNA (cytosine(967)-C(5))-methyltransferase RsmB [Verrucomicrobiae bacterium]|nr:16S rRNA (cytosine(967)-C(5))-methyltransferase RsmB [Verrucomicrobiae bacterium]